MHSETKRGRLVTIPSSTETQLCSENFEDKFSDLHESVVSRILSHLPTVEAVRTSVLSKTWRNAWTNVTALRFDDGRRRDPGDCRFTESVEGVLRGIGSPHINSFHLHSVNSCHETLLKSWLSNVLRRKLQRLVITCYKLESVNFSPLFAILGSVVELRLRTKSILPIWAPALLPNLKFFTLEDATFNVPSVSENLFLKFPVLETFEAYYCYFRGTETVIIDSPLLKIFEMFKCRSGHVPNDSGVCTIRVLASELEKFTFFQDRSQTILLSFPPSSLPNAYLSLGAKWPKKFLHSFTCLKSLALELSKDFEVTEVPIFRQLVYLHLRYYMTQDYTFRNFLKSTPILEVLSIHDLTSYRSIPPSEILNKLRSETAPECVRKMLKIVQIRNFDTEEHQLSVLRYVMENAKVLGLVVLSSPYRITETAKSEILSYPKASPHASVFFERSR